MWERKREWGREELRESGEERERKGESLHRGSIFLGLFLKLERWTDTSKSLRFLTLAEITLLNQNGSGQCRFFSVYCKCVMRAQVWDIWNRRLFTLFWYNGMYIHMCTCLYVYTCVYTYAYVYFYKYTYVNIGVIYIYVLHTYR